MRRSQLIKDPKYTLKGYKIKFNNLLFLLNLQQYQLGIYAYINIAVVNAMGNTCYKI